MRWADPSWFFALIPLTLWAGWIYVARRNRSALPHPDLSLLKGRTASDSKEETILDIMKVLAFLLIIIALARPQQISNLKEPPKPVVDIVLCLDTSMSMSALDFDPQNRLDQAKKAAEEFIGKRPHDRIGLVVFGGKAITQCPLTLDHETLKDFLRTIPMNATQMDGTAIGTALAASSNLLSQSEAKTKIVILLTDGRSNVGSIDPVTAANAAKELGIKIYAIGTAVPGGGVVPVEDPVFGKRLVQMAEDLDETTLLEIARVTGAKYFRVTSAKRFKEIYDEIDALEKTKIAVESTSKVNDSYSGLLIAAVLLLFGAVLLDATVWRTVP